MYRNQNNNYRIYYPGKPYNKKKIKKLDKKRNIKNYDLIWLIDNAMSNIHYANYLNSINYAEGKITTFKTGLGTKKFGRKELIVMYPKKSKTGIDTVMLSDTIDDCITEVGKNVFKVNDWCKDF